MVVVVGSCLKVVSDLKNERWYGTRRCCKQKQKKVHPSPPNGRNMYTSASAIAGRLGGETVFSFG